MVTILPIDIDESVVQEGVQMAVAERLAARLKAFGEVVAELRGGGCIDRGEWVKVTVELRREVEISRDHLDYARAFLDQWPANE